MVGASEMPVCSSLLCLLSLFCSFCSPKKASPERDTLVQESGKGNGRAQAGCWAAQGGRGAGPDCAGAELSPGLATSVCGVGVRARVPHGAVA